MPLFPLSVLKQIADEVRADTVLEGRAYGVAVEVLRRCFGEIWFDKHIRSEPKNGFFYRPFHSGGIGVLVTMQRIRDVGECVVNILPLGGSEAPLSLLANGQIESAAAELAAGKNLVWRGARFRFIWPNGVTGESYDVEVVFPNGMAVATDTKCKIETNLFSPAGFRNSLDDARKRNLPKGRPGAVFVKIPQAWMLDAGICDGIRQETQNFLEGTRRIVLVNIWASTIDAAYGQLTTQREEGWEQVNPSHDFNTDLDWRLFSHNGGSFRPPHWLSLLDIVRSVP